MAEVIKINFGTSTMKIKLRNIQSIKIKLNDIRKSEFNKPQNERENKVKRT